jgi:hypothetical protein
MGAQERRSFDLDKGNRRQIRPTQSYHRPFLVDFGGLPGSLPHIRGMSSIVNPAAGPMPQLKSNKTKH